MFAATLITTWGTICHFSYRLCLYADHNSELFVLLQQQMSWLADFSCAASHVWNVAEFPGECRPWQHPAWTVYIFKHWTLWWVWVTSECMSGDPCHCSCALFAGRQRGDWGGTGVRGVEDHQGTNLLQAAPGKQSGKRNIACACISLCVSMCCLCVFLFCVRAPHPPPPSHPATQPSRTAFWEKYSFLVISRICFCFAHLFTSIFFYWW